MGGRLFGPLIAFLRIIPISMRSSLILSTLSLLALTASARQRTDRELLQATAGREILQRDSAIAIIARPDGGFKVVLTDSRFSDKEMLIGYSDNEASAEQFNPAFQWWLNQAEARGRQLQRSTSLPLTVIAPPEGYEPEIDALVTARWGQEAPYWNMCPDGTESSSGWGYEGGNGRCVTGCVATAMAQVMYYHQAPLHGCGGVGSVSVKQAGGSYRTYTVDYDQAEYDFENMLDKYSYGNYTQEQADAVAQLMYHCGVATKMQYATDGSGAWMEDCVDGLQRYFGFTEAQLLDRDRYTESQWMDYVYTEINEGRPIIYAGDDMVYRAGHCFVLDGYDERGFVHINWGWDGSSDGFFDIAILNAQGYHFSSYQQMIIGVQGDNQKVSNNWSDTLTVTAPGEVALRYGHELQGDTLLTLQRVTVNGPIDATDIAALRSLARLGSLRQLDLGATLFDEALPDSAFALATRLRKVVLPRNISRIGKRAFAGCTGLTEIRVPSRDVPAAGIGAFDEVSADRCRISVPAGTKDKYSRAYLWKQFLTKEFDNIVEFGTAITPRNVVREQYQPNPELTYTVYGSPVQGTPVLSCEATPDSPVGKYPITIEPGTITDPDVDFLEGFLIVIESTQSIEQIQNDADATVRLYDLQGRHVAQPEAGKLYIRK